MSFDNQVLVSPLETSQILGVFIEVHCLTKNLDRDPFL
jgi:hypothetical protein